MFRAVELKLTEGSFGSRNITGPENDFVGLRVGEELFDGVEALGVVSGGDGRDRGVITRPDEAPVAMTVFALVMAAVISLILQLVWLRTWECLMPRIGSGSCYECFIWSRELSCRHGWFRLDVLLNDPQPAQSGISVVSGPRDATTMQPIILTRIRAEGFKLSI